MNKKLIIAASLLLIVVLAHGGSSHSHQHSESEHPYLKQLKEYVQTNVTNKYGQVALSILVVSFPSIPVFLSLSFLGKVLKKKGDKNNFSSSLLTLLLAFACGTLLGDVMLHILPYLFSPSHGHSHSHEIGHTHTHFESHAHAHTHSHVDLSQKPAGGCPFANLFGQGKAEIPNDAAHAHLHQHDHTHDHNDIHQDHAHDHDHDHDHHDHTDSAQNNQNQIPHDHAHDDNNHEHHSHDHAAENHDHDHTHDHAHDHDHDHHNCDHHHKHTAKEQVHAQTDLLKKEGDHLLHPEHDHHHEHAHVHGGDHGHSHSVEEMIVPLMIIGGIIIFIVLDYIFMKIHKSSEKKDKKVEEKSSKKDDKSKKSKECKEEEEHEHSDEDDHHHHHHSHGDDEQSAVPFLIGDFLHNFTDGLAIGAAYTVSFQMGITSTFVIMIHELPHEIGDFAHLIKLNYNLGRILKTQFLTSLGALIGGFIGLYTGEIYKRELLSITAGGFIYMCCANVIPEIQADLRKDHSVKNLISVIISISVGVALMVYVAMLE